jgi:pimeloyl-ACP methyl ester carboxylesterase
MESILTYNNCPIHYWLDGPEGAPLVVFTHGATIDHHEWDATIPLVAEHFRVLTWDIRGHGLSRPARFTVADAMEDLVALLDHIGVQQATFVGHSMGGNLQQELVFHHPERVKALVMVDCTWNFQQLSAMDQWMLKLAKPLFALYPYKALVDQSVAVSAHSKAAQDLMRTAMNHLTKDEFVHIMMTMVACLHYEPTYRIPVPMLMLMGDGESTGNIRKVMPIWAKEEGCELVIVPNAEHAANLDNPEFFHSNLLDFLKKL